MKQLFALGFILFSLAAVFPACGTRPLLKIGLALPFTGYDQERGYNAIYAVKEALAEANARGGVGGYMVELVAVDDRNDPGEAVRQARELTLYEDMVGVIGHHSDACTLAAIPEYGRAGMPLVAPWLVSTGREGLTWETAVFPLAAPAEVLSHQLAEIVPRQRLALLTDDSPDGRALVRAFPAGWPVVFRGETGRGQRDLVTLARQVAGARPDVVFYSGHATEAALLLLALREVGVRAPFYGGPDLDDPKFLRLAGATAEGVIFIGLAQPGPAGAGYRQRTGRDPDDRATGAYNATVLLLAAIEDAARRDGRPTRAGVARSLGELAGSHQATSGVIYQVTGGMLKPLSNP